MFKSIYADQLSQYYILRIENLSDSAGKHELCYLKCKCQAEFDDSCNPRTAFL